MKLLLDELWWPELAAQLRERGHDVVAVQERPDLLGKDDERIFAVAQVEGRAILTEDPAFRGIAAMRIHSGMTHHGLIMTSNSRFPRGEPRTLGRLVKVLDALLTAHPGDDAFENREHWPE